MFTLPLFLKVKRARASDMNQHYPNVNYSRTKTMADDNSAMSSDDGSTDALIENSFPLSGPKRPFWRRHTAIIIVHIILFSFYIVSLYFVATHHKPYKFTRKEGLPFSPAIEALEYEEATFVFEEKVKVDDQLRGAFAGKPSASIDKAWHDLLDPENIRIEPEVVEHYGRLDTAIQIPDGSGYMAVLNVYHELHCIKRIHQYMYKEHYFPDLDEELIELNRKHNEHCIDYLRQAAMCHGDIGLMTFEWAPDSRVPVARATTHQCAKWDNIENWSRNRSVDIMKPGWLMHPTLGYAYKDRMPENSIGVISDHPGGHTGY
jgi:hypothetical protein